ncbi:MAG: hypothetical protein Q9188_006018 [Gyalolechia gomerana]
MEAKPTYEFYIPSLYDEIALACRIYTLPENYFGGTTGDGTTGKKPWTPLGAVVAHPWARMGGSFDDPTVGHIVAELLRLGFTVGTFNLRYDELSDLSWDNPMLTTRRGAGKSKGKSTWSSKAELQDYISFVGFFTYYLSNLHPPIPETEDDFYSLAPVLSGVPVARPPAHLLLAGYSFGALLTRHLPNIPAVLGRFAKVLKTSTEAEIRMRATRLAAVTTIDLLLRKFNGAESRRTLKGKAPDRGNEPATVPEKTFQDWIEEKKEYLILLQSPFVRKEKRNSWPDEALSVGPDDDDYVIRVDIPTPKSHYLLVSLLLEPLSLVCTGLRKLVDADEDRLDYKFLYNTTLVVHGGKDRFTSVKKIGYWGSEIKENSDGRFKSLQVAKAGHFWRDKEEYLDLRWCINQWVLGWLHGGETESNRGSVAGGRSLAII